MKHTKTQKKDIIRHIMYKLEVQNTSQIQKKLLTTYKIPLSTRSIRKYKADIKKDIDVESIDSNVTKFNVIQPKPVEILEKKKVIKLERKYDIVIDAYPFWIHCPICKHGMRLERNPIQSSTCAQCGVKYDRKNKCFIKLGYGEIIERLNIYDPVIDDPKSGT